MKSVRHNMYFAVKRLAHKRGGCTTPFADASSWNVCTGSDLKSLASCSLPSSPPLLHSNSGPNQLVGREIASSGFENIALDNAGSQFDYLKSEQVWRHLSSWETLASPDTLKQHKLAYKKLLVALRNLQMITTVPEKEVWDRARKAYRAALDSAPHLVLWVEELRVSQKGCPAKKILECGYNALPRWISPQVLLRFPWTKRERHVRRAEFIATALYVTLYLARKQNLLLLGLTKILQRLDEIVSNLAA